MTLNLFLARLKSLVPLSLAEQQALENINPKKRNVPKNTSLLPDAGSDPSSYVILEGIGARHVRLAPHHRQILAFILPGDAWNLEEGRVGAAGHAFRTLTDCVIIEIARADMLSLYDHPGLAEALRRTALIDQSIAYAWLTNLGRRSAERRLAHLFCELFSRLKSVGRASDEGFDLPLTQTDLADALGLSLVHTNKSLQRLRRMGHFEWDGGRMSIHDFDGLRRFAEFDGSYLVRTELAL